MVWKTRKDKEDRGLKILGLMRKKEKTRDTVRHMKAVHASGQR